jgi:hypothetical protein
LFTAPVALLIVSAAVGHLDGGRRFRPRWFWLVGLPLIARTFSTFAL